MYVNRTPGGNTVADNHYFDTEREVTTVVTNTASWTATEYDPNPGAAAKLCMFFPVTGNDIMDREGRKIFVKKIRIAGQITLGDMSAQTAAPEPVNVRIIVYQDKQTNATQAQGEDVISSGAGSDALHMSQNTANFGRFRVLKDKYFVLGKNANVAGLTTAFVVTGDVVNFKFNIKVNQWVNYNATNGGTVADVVDNSWHLIANRNGDARTVQITYKARTVFKP